MIGKMAKIILTIIIGFIFLNQPAAWAQDECLRQKAFGDRKEKSLAEALQSFGIRAVQGHLDFTNVPDDVEWVMDSIRQPEEGPIITLFEQIPIANLHYPLEDIKKLPPISTMGSSSAGVYVGLIEWQGELCPAAIKLFSKSKTLQKWEVEAVQACDRLGISPHFYGLIKDENGRIVGYAMQVGIGDPIPWYDLDGFEDSKESEEVDEIKNRLWSVGLSSAGEYLMTRKSRVISIDAGGTHILHDVADAADKYHSFVRKMNESGVSTIEARPPQSGNPALSPNATLAAI